jgi:hypothetical protein
MKRKNGEERKERVRKSPILRLHKNVKHNKMEIDCDPLTRTDGETFRPFLNDEERFELTKRQLSFKAIKLFDELGDMHKVADAMSEDGIDDTYNLGVLMTEVNPEVKKQFTLKVIDRILDLNLDETRTQLCEALGLTKIQLRNLMQTDFFREEYSRKFIEIRSDPNIPLVRQAVVEDLLPKAFMSLQEELSPAAPWSVRQKARQDIFKLAGVEAVKPQENDRLEAAAFLAKHNVTITIEKKPDIPSEYREAVIQALPANTNNDLLTDDNEDIVDTPYMEIASTSLQD